MQHLFYRFSIFPQIEGERSRVELSTCFVQKNQLPMLFGSPSLDPAVGMTTSITRLQIILDKNIEHNTIILIVR